MKPKRPGPRSNSKLEYLRTLSRNSRPFASAESASSAGIFSLARVEARRALGSTALVGPGYAQRRGGGDAPKAAGEAAKVYVKCEFEGDGNVDFNGALRILPDRAGIELQRETTRRARLTGVKNF